MASEQFVGILKRLLILSDLDPYEFQAERSWFPLIFLLPTFFFVHKQLIAAGGRLASVLNVAKRKRIKFAESFSFFIVYATCCGVNSAILIRDGSFLNRAAVWDNLFDVDRFAASIEPLRIVQLTQISFYIACLGNMFFSDRRHHKDFPVMFIHHGVTICLIFISYPIPMFHRIAITTMLVHDVSDVFLEGSKLLNYAFGGGAAQYTFLTFSLVFPLSRLGLYPYLCVWNFVVYSPIVVREHLGHPAMAGDHGTVVRYSIITLFLVTLQVMHVYWFALIAKMVINQIRGKKLDDIRSPSDSKVKSVR